MEHLPEHEEVSTEVSIPQPVEPKLSAPALPEAPPSEAPQIFRHRPPGPERASSSGVGSTKKPDARPVFRPEAASRRGLFLGLLLLLLVLGGGVGLWMFLGSENKAVGQDPDPVPQEAGEALKAKGTGAA